MMHIAIYCLFTYLYYFKRQGFFFFVKTELIYQKFKSVTEAFFLFDKKCAKMQLFLFKKCAKSKKKLPTKKCAKMTKLRHSKKLRKNLKNF